MLDAKTGANQLSNAWMLVYAYWPPYEAADQKYLVFRDVTVSISKSPVTPQVGVLLARWYNPASHDRWSTTAAVPGNYTSYKLEKETGYLMTVADAAKPSVELEDCQPAARASRPSARGERILRGKQLSTPTHCGLGICERTTRNDPALPLLQLQRSVSLRVK